VVHRTGILDHIDLRVWGSDRSITRRLFGPKVWPQVPPALAGRPHDSRVVIMSIAIKERELDINNFSFEAKICTKDLTAFDSKIRYLSTPNSKCCLQIIHIFVTRSCVHSGLVAGSRAQF